MLVISCTQASKSGAARYVYELHNEISKIKNDSILIAPNNFDFLHLVENLVPYRELDVKKGKVKKTFSMIKQFFDSTIKINEIVKNSANKKIILHFNFPGLPALSILQFISVKNKNVRLFFTVHDVLPHKWLFPDYLRGVEFLLLKMLYKIPNIIIVHHESQRVDLIKKFGMEAKKIKIAPHGVFGLSSAPLKYKKEDEYNLLCFGAIRKNKGVILAIKAVQALREQGFPVVLTIAGAASKGELDYWVECKKAIDGSPDGILVHEGYVGDDELKKFFSNAHAILLPYVDFHSQSGVATMALSNGRVIISTQSGGLSDLVNNKEYAFEIKNADIAGVCDSIKRVVSTGHDKLEYLGDLAFKDMMEKYSWSSVAKIHCDYYEECD
ncbi:glycosyltransferase family 4 protein [Sphaerotilus sp.]|uniref:glycosyltransferase family 4 protein n=1 Tax=Sphaerotilus sp. TaxID=2093942 RepID=UPI002ACEF1CC|nr:glycosyltransferase family 4 protein [Sphaerotilus sp.]MDZ7856205.1 glycosyltransferase family 4 protein [Sphaerotilus sp.]